jgi:hypothetical protein
VPLVKQAIHENDYVELTQPVDKVMRLTIRALTLHLADRQERVSAIIADRQ